MKALQTIAAAATMLACVGHARADDAKKITVGDAISLAVGLRNMDGHQVVSKQTNGQETIVMVPWDFGSGTLRGRLAADLVIAAMSERLLEDSRAAIVREILKKFPSGTPRIPPETPEFDEFQTQIKEVLTLPAPGSQDLARIKISELKLEKNEIPVTALSALSPILDMDAKQ